VWKPDTFSEAIALRALCPADADCLRVLPSRCNREALFTVN
jgi:hypothetical protein